MYTTIKHQWIEYTFPQPKVKEWADFFVTAVIHLTIIAIYLCIHIYFHTQTNYDYTYV